MYLSCYFSVLAAKRFVFCSDKRTAAACSLSDKTEWCCRIYRVNVCFICLFINLQWNSCNFFFFFQRNMSILCFVLQMKFGVEPKKITKWSSSSTTYLHTVISKLSKQWKSKSRFSTVPFFSTVDHTCAIQYCWVDSLSFNI